MALLLYVLVAPILVWFLYQQLRRYRIAGLRRIPSPPTSLVWGHLKFMNDVYKRGNPQRNADYVLEEIAESLGHPEVFVLDLRPVLGRMAVICSHLLAEQTSRPSQTFKYSVPKSKSFRQFVPLIGSESILIKEVCFASCVD